jgi:hypothetical protein
MLNLAFTPPEIRFAILTLASLTAIILAIYLLWPQSSTQHLETFNKFIQNYSTLRPQALTTHASRNFTHSGLPLSLAMPIWTLQPFQSHATMIFSLFSDFKMKPQVNGSSDSVYFSRETNIVIAYCMMGGKVNTESEMGAKLGLSEWWTECVLFVRMSKDGKRIEEVEEFVDSAKAEELQKRLGNVLSEAT